MHRDEAYRISHRDYEGAPLDYDPWEDLESVGDGADDAEPGSRVVVFAPVSNPATTTTVRHPIARAIMGELDDVEFVD